MPTTGNAGRPVHQDDRVLDCSWVRVDTELHATPKRSSGRLACGTFQKAVPASRGKKILWITWETQVRNRSMASALQIPLFVVLSGGSRLRRYASCIRRTFSIVRKEGPKVIICQNPSLILTLFLLSMRKWMGFRLAVDAHFGGVESYTGTSALQRVLDSCNRSADLVIVTNDGHADHVRRIGGQAFVCADPLPDLSAYRGCSIEERRKVFFICSFDIDEPYHEVFSAAEMLRDSGFQFAVSGNYFKAGIAPDRFPNVCFLGFVPEHEYYSHLYSSEVVIDLTEHDNCLVCGAYEAIAAEKPLVLSKKRALESHFRDSAVFTENDSASIANAVILAYEDRVRLRESCVRWAAKNRIEMSATISRLAINLQNL